MSSGRVSLSSALILGRWEGEHIIWGWVSSSSLGRGTSLYMGREIQSLIQGSLGAKTFMAISAGSFCLFSLLLRGRLTSRALDGEGDGVEGLGVSTVWGMTADWAPVGVGGGTVRTVGLAPGAAALSLSQTSANFLALLKVKGRSGWEESS